MYKHILIPTDGSPLAQKAVDAGIDYAREAGARVTFFTALPEYEVPGEGVILSRGVMSLAEHDEASRHKAEARLAPMLEKARSAGVEAAREYAESNQPADAIVAAARRNGCDAIFMSSHGRGPVAALVHGSETLAVLAQSDIPTVVYR